MERDAATYLFDMREAGARLRRFTAGKTFNDYSQDELLQSAVERQFEILGEALTQLNKLAPDVIPLPTSQKGQNHLGAGHTTSHLLR